jgi:hypothetical protein
MGRVFLLLHNLEVACLLCILYGFPVVGQDYKICNTRYTYATHLPHASTVVLVYLMMSQSDPNMYCTRKTRDENI